jgi:thiamine biosynthesis protein ThiI
MPLFRPLIGMDKDEIMAQAQTLGSYPISIIPDQDCCTLFTPRNPATRARFDEADAAESGLPLTALIDACLRGVEVEDFAFPAVEPVVGSRA